MDMDDFPLLEEFFPAKALEEEKEEEGGAASDPHVLTVTRFLEECQEGISSWIPTAWVQGEISNLRIPSSGYLYFTLKDSHSQLRAVLVKTRAASLPFSLEAGMDSICVGAPYS